MKRRTLVARALRHFWRTNLAVIAGVATAVAVLSGALIVGDSVRGSLRDLVLARLGRTDRVITSPRFFRDGLASDIQRDRSFVSSYAGIVPLISMQGIVSDQSTGRRASGVQVYAVDDRFWRFHRISGIAGPADREAFLSRALARDIGAAADGTILVRVERPSAIPLESLHGRKDDPGRTLRLAVRAVLDRAQLGEFSMRPQQGDVRAVFVPLARLQRDLAELGRANTLLIADRPEAPSESLPVLLKRHATAEDYGLTVRTIDAQKAIAVENEGGFIDAARSAAVERAAAAGQQTTPVLTYLANAIRNGSREVPYSLVTAADLTAVSPQLRAGGGTPPPIVINEWTARDLAVHVGNPLTLDYYVWEEPGILSTKSAAFRVADIVPLAGAAADRQLAPVYPGITEAKNVSDWDPPFPIDLKRVRPKDEAYWEQYRTTPKAFVPFEVGRRLWGSPRYGDRTSIRVSIFDKPLGAALRFQDRLALALDPAAAGFVISDVRRDGLDASRGSTDFGEYFVYFSFFLVVSALVLAALFFRLGVEQRAREIGLLRAVGYSPRRVRRLFTTEGFALAVAGSVIGMAGAVGYGALMMAGLRTWWSGAVGTTALTLHVSPVSLIGGSVGALAAATTCIWWTLRGLGRVSERALLAGEVRRESAVNRQGGGRLAAASAIVLALVAIALVAAASAKTIAASGAFFGAGSALLVACLCLLDARLTRARGRAGADRMSVPRLGVRNMSERPGRAVLAVAVIASATFILIAVDAFRVGRVDAADRRSGTGGYPLLVDLQLPLVHDPNSRDGRDDLGIPAGADLAIEPFRLLPGEDASCLNLYEPTRPRILGVGHRLIAAGRFSFQDSLAATPETRANPWLLLEQPLPDRAIPAIADANSLTYVLHKRLGDDVVIPRGGATVRLRIVAALSDSIFQGELLVSDANFVAAFPEQQGYRFLLVDAPGAKAGQLGDAIEKTAGDLGADAVPTGQRLAEFHAVENTYLSTFQTLGGLGLLVGTIGLAAVLLRNVLERRRELALLRAVGYGRGDVFTVILAENAMLLAWGLGAGALSAAIAIVPAALERGARVPMTAGGLALVLAVLAAGLLSSALATRFALRTSLVSALRSE